MKRSDYLSWYCTVFTVGGLGLINASVYLINIPFGMLVTGITCMFFGYVSYTSMNEAKEKESNDQPPI